MEKSFSTYRDIIDTSDEDSDDLFLEDSDVNFRTSLASSTVSFPQKAVLNNSNTSDRSTRKTSEESPIKSVSSHSHAESNLSEEKENSVSETEDEDNLLTIKKKLQRHKPVIESSEDEVEDPSKLSNNENNTDSKTILSKHTPETRKNQGTDISNMSTSNSVVIENDSDKENSSQNRKSKSKDIEIQSSSSVEEISPSNVSDVVCVSSDDETPILQSIIPQKSSTPQFVQPQKPSTPKLVQPKIHTMLPSKMINLKTTKFHSGAQTSNSYAGSSIMQAPPNIKYSSREEYHNQEQKVAILKQKLSQIRNALATIKLETLPDRGSMLLQREVFYTNELAKEEAKLSKMLIEAKIQTDSTTEKVYGLSWKDLQKLSSQVQPAGVGGKKAMDTYHTQKTLTMDRLKTLHNSLESKPAEDVMIDDPKFLKVELMAHQKHALAFLLWRENQKPSGGILADDMGLGKTLTMIALILKARELSAGDGNKTESDSESNSDDENKDSEWKNKRSREYYPGGTLVVCPASLINQWENEILKRCKRDCLSIYLYHGTNREMKSRRLAKHDVVITTYNLVGMDREKTGGIFGVRWGRIILDEAHVVRNCKSKSSLGVCALKGKKRWCLTGTPVQNKEIDLYALLKFLKCSPFDDLVIWKKWIDNKSAGGQERLNTVIQSIMLRRTKQQLQENGTMTCLPEKQIELINVKLRKDEMNIYQKILIFSKTLFAQFLHQRADKNSDLAYSVDSNQKFLNGIRNVEYEKAHQKMLKMHGTGEVKAHQILVLLLRLRQICCHVSLIKTMIENEACSADGIEDVEGNDIDLLEQLDKLDLNDEDNAAHGSTETNENTDDKLGAAASKVLNSADPIFNTSNASSKVKMIVDTVKTKAISKGDKAIVVSQWTSMLKIIEEHLVKEGVKCETLCGNVPVHKRMALVDEFNKESSSLQVLLLSLTAGGVGLNLVGANHLLLVDLHWNPQLEAQAQDRIYRVGQKKDVNIYKFVTLDTIEQRIKALQDNKLAMATSLLTGTKRTGGSKLTIEDLKMLFNMS